MVPSAKYREGRTLRVVLGVLAAAGLLISTYLTWVHFARVAPVCVGGSGGVRDRAVEPLRHYFGRPGVRAGARWLHGVAVFGFPAGRARCLSRVRDRPNRNA